MSTARFASLLHLWLDPVSHTPTNPCPTWVDASPPRPVTKHSLLWLPTPPYIHPGFSSSSAPSTFSVHPSAFSVQQDHHTATKKPRVEYQAFASHDGRALCEVLNPPRPLLMHLNSLPPSFSPLIETEVCVPRPASPHAALAATRHHDRRSSSGHPTMELGSECDGVSSGLETSRAVKSVLGDDVSRDSTSDFDSLSEDDGRSACAQSLPLTHPSLENL